jgi:hypothetical protein
MNGLWIRSQDKKTLRNAFDVSNVAKSVYADDELAGTYATEERALEVLNTIQSAIVIGSKIFQMPQE